jgi:hypothetical protein
MKCYAPQENVAFHEKNLIAKESNLSFFLNMENALQFENKIGSRIYVKHSSFHVKRE